jgi:hypothetical protein
MRRRYVVGTLGVVDAIAVAVILGVHPLGSTDLYDDGARFTDHVGLFWVAIHVVGAVLLLVVPTVIGAWSETLETAAGQVFARMATTIAIGGVTVAVLHLAGTDTVSFLTYQDTLDSGLEGSDAGADVLLRVHAATLTAFALMLFVALPAAVAIAKAMDHDRTWRFWLPTAVAALASAAVVVTLLERQWTSLSEMGLLRPSMVLFLLWYGLLAYELRRSATAEEHVRVASEALDAEAPRGLA